jgi:hypothetical protein
MQRYLAPYTEAPGGRMCISVTNEERSLKEHDARVPHLRTSTQRRQHQACCHRLYHEHKGRAEKERPCK